jgi:hypothetical protein
MKRTQNIGYLYVVCSFSGYVHFKLDLIGEKVQDC